MSRSEGDLVDTLISSVCSISNELSRYAQALGDYSQDAADKLEKGFDSYADTIRQSMRQNSWVPESMKPPAPRPPPRAVQLGLIAKCTDWVDKHRAITAAVVGFVGTTAFLVYRHQRLSKRKRRARRATSGAKTEVVVLAGSPFAHITKSLALDLEKRGFLVYIPVGSLEEEAAVAELRVANIHALNFDITSAESTKDMIEKFANLLYHPHRHGTDRLHMAALVVVEGLNTSSPQPAHTISTSTWSDSLNTRILYPISLTQTFLPLLVSESKSPAVTEPTSLVFLTSSNISSLNTPTHAQESVTTAALSSYISTLKAELPKSVNLTHLRLGSLALQATPANKFDMALARIRKFTPSSSSSSASTSPSRHVSKNEDQFHQTAELRKLNHGVFDAVVGRTSGTVFLGRGALMYAVVGALAPSSLVSWMVGYRRDGYDFDVQQVFATRTKAKSLSSSSEWEGISASSHPDA